MAAAAMAADYTDSLAIYINGATTPVTTPATISVNQASNGTYTFTLKNFTLTMGGQTMYIGNVQLDNVYSFNGTNGRTILAGGKDVVIQSGDDASKQWIGPMMGEVEVALRGYQVDNRIYAYMDIEVESMNMDIRCVFGRGFSLINGGFETYHKASVSMEGNTATSDEPDGWHSFMSASGDPTLVYLAGYNPHTFISNLVRPGSNGKHSLMLTSVDMWIAIANGTVTTGRINTGSMTAADLANHAWLSLDSTGTDAKGDPFYQYMNGRPDSLALWVKFKQGTPNADHPYATVSAIITDGTYYQDPKGDDLYNDNGLRATTTSGSASASPSTTLPTTTPQGVPSSPPSLPTPIRVQAAPTRSMSTTQSSSTTTTRRASPSMVRNATWCLMRTTTARSPSTHKARKCCRATSSLRLLPTPSLSVLSMMRIPHASTMLC